MGSRFVIPILIAVVFLVPALEADGVTVTIDTVVPSYILDDHLDLSGTVNVTHATWEEEGRAAFSRGTLHNVTVDASSGDVVLEPELSFKVLNNGNPVLRGGVSAWDTHIMDQMVVKHNGTYWMYYTGGTTTNGNQYYLQNAYHIGLATSTNGISWTKYSGNPILSARVDSFDYTHLCSPIVIVENGTFHMYYSGNRGSRNPSQLQDINVCYANSTDGYNWTKYSSNPVLLNGPATTDWNGNAVRPGSVVRGPDGKLLLHVRGKGLNQPAGLGAATSVDFKSWAYVTNKALYTSDATGWEDAHTYYNQMEHHNGTSRVWTHSDRTSWHVGWIWSEDGVNWTDSGSAVISPTAGTIYASDVFHPLVVDMGDHQRMYVTCRDASGVRTVGCLEATASKLNGTYTSAIKDLGGLADLTDARMVTNVTSGAVARVYIRWSNDSANWSGWRELDGAWKPDGVSARYVQYKVEFRSERDWLRPRLEGFYLDYSLPITAVEYSVDGGPWQEATWNQTDWSANVSLHDGDYDVLVRVTDTRGSTVTATMPV